MNEKKHFLIFILLLPLFCKAQPYQSIFGQESTEFHIASRGLGSEKLIGTDTATVIKVFQYNGHLWHKVHFPRHFEYLNCREVIDSGRIYCKTGSDTILNFGSEYLLFDMSLNQGDTFKFLFEYNFIDIPVDTIYYENGRKIIDFGEMLGFDSVGQILKFIEGIGPTSSLLELIWCDGYPFNTTLCVYQDAQLVYNSGLLGGRCTLEWVGIDSIERQDLKIWPNPADEKLNFQNVSGKNIKIKLYDQLGKTIMETSTSGQELNIEGLNPGLYFIEIENNPIQHFLKY